MLRTHIPKAIRVSLGLALLAGVLLFASPAQTAQAGLLPLLPPTNFCFFNGLVTTGIIFGEPAGSPGKVYDTVSVPLGNGQVLSVKIIETTLASFPSTSPS